MCTDSSRTKYYGDRRGKIKSHLLFAILPELTSQPFETSNQINSLTLSSIFLLKWLGTFISSHKLIIRITTISYTAWLLDIVVGQCGDHVKLWSAKTIRRGNTEQKSDSWRTQWPKVYLWNNYIFHSVLSTKKIVLSSFLSIDTIQSPLVPLIVHCPKTGAMGTIQTNKFIPFNLSYL